MKVVKKLMALVLASALALTLLTGCGGGGGGGGTVTVNGTTITVGGTNNENTEFTKNFINALSTGAGIHVTYSEAEAKKAQKYIKAASQVKNSDPSEDVIVAVLAEAGIDLSKETVLSTEETMTSHQIMDIAGQMDDWTEMMSDMGISVDYDGAEFGYVTATRTSDGATLLLMVMKYTAT